MTEVSFGRFGALGNLPTEFGLALEVAQGCAVVLRVLRFVLSQLLLALQLLKLPVNACKCLQNACNVEGERTGPGCRSGPEQGIDYREYCHRGGPIRSIFAHRSTAIYCGWPASPGLIPCNNKFTGNYQDT